MTPHRLTAFLHSAFQISHNASRIIRGCVSSVLNVKHLLVKGSLWLHGSMRMMRKKPVNASMLLPLCHPLTSHVCLCRSEFKRALTEKADSSGPSASRDNEQYSNAQVVLLIKVSGVYKHTKLVSADKVLTHSLSCLTFIWPWPQRPPLGP